MNPNSDPSIMWNCDINSDSQLGNPWAFHPDETFPVDWQQPVPHQPCPESARVSHRGQTAELGALNTANGWDSIGMDALEVDLILSQDPDYAHHGALSKGDPTSESLFVGPEFQWETRKSIEKLNQGSPLPRGNSPSPDIPGHQTFAYLPPLDCGMLTRTNGSFIQQEVYAVGDHLLAAQQAEEPITEAKHPESDHDTLVLKRASPQISCAGDIQARARPQVETKPGASRCAPCRFAGVPKSQCDGTVGSACSRCRYLESKVHEQSRKRAKELLGKTDGAAPYRPEFLVEPAESLSLPMVIFFELREAQRLLVALREEVDHVSCLSPGGSLESLFDGNLLCYIDDREYFSPFSVTSSAIGIRRLATVASATEASGANIVGPALDGDQLETFIRQRRPACESDSGLKEADREILIIAWSCAYWITMLLNWDRNEIYLSSETPSGISLPAAKNLVLELTYSVAHRIQTLIKELCYMTVKSMTNADEDHNPVTICCALWVVFTATHKFEKHNFSAKGLENLRDFLSKLHERSRAAFHSINQYKWAASARCCGHARDTQGDFVKWITEAKRPKSIVSFAFERHVSGPFPFFRGNDINYRFRPQSYSEILEAKVPFLEDDDLFNGLASFNVLKPWPSDCSRHVEDLRSWAAPQEIEAPTVFTGHVTSAQEYPHFPFSTTVDPQSAVDEGQGGSPSCWLPP